MLVRISNSKSHDAAVTALLPALKETMSDLPLFQRHLNPVTGGVRFRGGIDHLGSRITAPQLERLPFYQRVGRKLQIEDQIVIHILLKSDRGILVTFHGEERFREKELLKAAVVRGQIVARLSEFERQESKRTSTLRKLGGRLSLREQQVLTEVCRGSTNAAIAEELGIAKQTVDKHVGNILRRLELKNRREAIAKFSRWMDEPGK
jgi:DNA-binding CsgD family transcriptional regulator